MTWNPKNVRVGTITKNYIMKKSLKKLALNKTAVSDLTDQVKGGRPGSVIQTIRTTTDPTANTMCYICPVDEPRF